jgi:hypothetical protein
MRRKIWALTLFIQSFTLILFACDQASTTPTVTPPEPQAVYTAAAQTAMARLTEQASTSAPSPAPATDTPSPSETPEVVSSPPPSSTIETGGEDAAEFVADVSIPDGTTFTAGEGFVKTWRLKNAGSSTWTSDYGLSFFSGAQMAGPGYLPLSETVRPGELADLSISLTAPAEPGVQRGYWMLSNPAGDLFGIGPQNNLAFYVEINVEGTGGALGTATPTAFTSGDGAVAGLSLSVVPTSYTGACPHTFSFTAQVTMANPARVTLELEAGADDPTYNFSLPPPQSYDLGVSTYTYSYFLELSGSVNGWARLRVTFPENLTSNQANFTLNCE